MLAGQYLIDELCWFNRRVMRFSNVDHRLFVVAPVLNGLSVLKP